MIVVRLGILACVVAACTRVPAEHPPDWVAAFGYDEGALHEFQVREFGFPFLPVGIGGDTVWLPFDTGNMAGLTLVSDVFERLGLPCTEERNRRDSAGEIVFVGCVAHGTQAFAFGRRRDAVSVLEFAHPSLPGLIGPDMLPGTRFTLDYDAEVLASDAGVTLGTPAGFEELPLVRSPDHPLLILVWGSVEGRDALFELDTGKSRTTVDGELVDELDLRPAENGVRLKRVRLGPFEWSANSARIVNTSGISGGLPQRISIGIGSDVLQGFIVTVDYVARRVWIKRAS